MSATEARVHFGDLLRRVTESDEHVAIERGRKPVAVILSQTEYDRLMGSRLDDWWDLVLASQRAFAEARARGAPPDASELIREEREKRDAQLLDNLLRR